MKLWRSIGSTAIFLAALSVSVHAADLTGTVTNRLGHPVPGVQITLKNAAGKILGQKITDSSGRYAFKTVAPGKYQYVLDPLSTGLKGGSAASTVDSEGSTVDWRVSPNLLAAAAAAPGPNGPVSAEALAAGSGGGAQSNNGGGGADPLFVHSGPIGDPVGGPPGVGGVGSGSE
jgi:hypothetical protein